jgi:transcriptional regulator with XRE-family HTH domain
MKTPNLVGTNIRRYRKRAGLSQEALAEKLDLSLNFIGQVERGSRAPSFSSLGRIAQVLKVDVQDLFLPLSVKPLSAKQDRRQVLRLLRRLSPSQLRLLADLTTRIFQEDLGSP